MCVCACVLSLCRVECVCVCAEPVQGEMIVCSPLAQLQLTCVPVCQRVGQAQALWDAATWPLGWRHKQAGMRKHLCVCPCMACSHHCLAQVKMCCAHSCI